MKIIKYLYSTYLLKIGNNIKYALGERVNIMGGLRIVLDSFRPLPITETALTR